METTDDKICRMHGDMHFVVGLKEELRNKRLGARGLDQAAGEPGVRSESPVDPVVMPYQDVGSPDVRRSGARLETPSQEPMGSTW